MISKVSVSVGSGLGVVCGVRSVGQRPYLLNVISLLGSLVEVVGEVPDVRRVSWGGFLNEDVLLTIKCKRTLFSRGEDFVFSTAGMEIK